jgi:hypothetical protein
LSTQTKIPRAQTFEAKGYRTLVPVQQCNINITSRYYIIAKHLAARHFLHGLLMGLANSAWITASHILLFTRYIANHPREAAMMTSMPLPDSPREMMALTGPVIGLVSGLVLGLFALVAGKLLKRSQSA